MKTRDQYVISEVVETSGAVAYFRVATETQLSTLADAWRKEGLDAALLPKPPEDLVALGRAVNAMAEKRRLVRPLERRGAWAIVEETVKQGEPPTYRTLVTVRQAAGAPQINMVDATGLEWAQLSTSIDKDFLSARNTLAHHDISSWLIDLAYSNGAVSLRESGGVYFIPRQAMDLWRKIVTAVDASGSSVFTIPAMRTAEAVAAITDAITQEAVGIAAKIEAELIATGDSALGQRAIKTRIKESEALLAKLATYEELVGRQLEIRERITTMQGNAAALLLSVTTETEAA